MGRPRKGVVEANGVHTAALPVALGSRHRVQFRSTDGQAVRRWYADGERALAAGTPLPDPDGYRTAHRQPEPAAMCQARPLSAQWWAGPSAAEGHDFVKVAHAYVRQRYDILRQAQPERRAAVVAVIDNDLAPWLTRHGASTIERIENQLVARLAGHLAGQTSLPAPKHPRWPHLDVRREITLAEACGLDGVCRSTLKRWHDQGLLPAWRVDQTDRRVRVNVDELRAAVERRPRAERRTGLAKSTATNKLAVLKLILTFAEANGIPLTGLPMEGISAVEPDPEVAITPARVEDNHLPLMDARRIAAHLTVVQQLAFWLERILGARIGESFGPKVADVIHLGPDVAGILRIACQGGRRFKVRDGDTVAVVDEKERLKTAESRRVILVPRQLMELFRIVIAAYHTDPVTGEVDEQARLIPGLRAAGRSGQQTHRGGFSRAVAAAGLDQLVYGPITPHTMRDNLITDLERAGVDEWLARRFVGHIAGKDVHARYYLRDAATGFDAASNADAVAMWRPVADALERMIDEQLGGTLIVPTTTTDVFGRAHPLRARRDHICATLAAHGWFVEPHVIDERGSQALLGTEAIAERLGVAAATARRWMREEMIPATRVRRGRQQVWMCRIDDVDVFQRWLADNPTITDLAASMGLSYHQLYRKMTDLAVIGTRTRRGGEIRLPPAAVAALRRAHEAERETMGRAIPISVAAVELRVPVLIIETLIRRGVLVQDQAATTARMRYVTRDSLADYAESRKVAALPVPDGVPVLPDAEARQITGLTRPALATLVASGVLVAVTRARRRYITEDSIRAWAQNARRLDVLTQMQGDVVGDERLGT